MKVYVAYAHVDQEATCYADVLGVASTIQAAMGLCDAHYGKEHPTVYLRWLNVIDKRGMRLLSFGAHDILGAFAEKISYFVAECEVAP